MSDARRPAAEVLANLAVSQVLLVSTPSTYARVAPRLLTRQCFLDAARYLSPSGAGAAVLYGDQDYEPNHGLLLIASALAGAGITVACLELNAYGRLYSENVVQAGPDALLAMFVGATRPQVVGISSMTPNVALAKAISNRVREQQPGAMIVLGGMATCDVSQCFMNSSFDAVVEGDGEEAFVELVRRVLAGNRVPSLCCVRYRETSYSGAMSNKVHSAYKYTRSTLLPAYESLPRELPLIPRVFLSRGCSRGCGFCSPAAFFFGKVRVRSPHVVADEIAYLHAHFDFEWFVIGDLSFHLHSRPAIVLLERMSSMDLRPWWMQTQLSYITEESAKTLKMAGCRQVAVGIEGFDLRDAAVARKNGGRERARRALSYLKAAGIEVQTYWMFGLPEETYDDSVAKINDICGLVRAGLIDAVHISYAVPYPNTELAADERVQITSDDFSHMLGSQSRYYSSMPMHRTRHLSEKEILLLTQLATACSANEFASRGGGR